MPEYNNDVQNTEELEIKRRVEDLPVEGVAEDAEDFDEFDYFDEFSAKSPEPHTWPVKTQKFYLSHKDKLYITVMLAIIALFAVLAVTVSLVWHFHSPQGGVNNGTTEGDTNVAQTENGTKGETLFPTIEFVPAGISDSADDIAADFIKSTNAVFLDVTNMTVTASCLADERTYPASLTKVMTLIVAVENLRGTSALSDTITVSEEVFKKMREAGASGAGLEPGERLSVESMLYALMLKSDGIAACELAKYVAGSEEAFVALMNDTAERLGLEDTHFVNPTGLHDNDHYSTCRDLANIMAYAMQNEFCKKVMTEELFVAPCTQANGNRFDYQLYHSLLVTQFDKLNKTSPNGAVVTAGKTGYTEESGYCLVTYAQADNGNGYVVVTTGASSYSDCISDYITVYEAYIP
ncbi:MAG: D-alanyl-D-alanine carboxypeptidase [Ruminococcaceae bacterium]|nr:D-alanyl-D-alanine carboxypeptidase [Oscillospiraceae bacterium]